MIQTRKRISDRSTLVFEAGEPVAVESESDHENALEYAEQYLGHPLEFADPEQRDSDGLWVWRVWFHEDCDCGCQAK